MNHPIVFVPKLYKNKFKTISEIHDWMLCEFNGNLNIKCKGLISMGALTDL